MSAWSKEELPRMGRAEEIDIAVRRPDGGLRDRVTIWVVPHSDALYVRSVNGRDGAWFRAVQETYKGRVWAGGVEKERHCKAQREGQEEEADLKPHRILVAARADNQRNPQYSEEEEV